MTDKPYRAESGGRVGRTDAYIVAHAIGGVPGLPPDLLAERIAAALNTPQGQAAMRGEPIPDGLPDEFALEGEWQMAVVVADPNEVQRRLAEVIAQADAEWNGTAPKVWQMHDHQATAVLDIIPKLLAEHPEAFGVEFMLGCDHYPEVPRLPSRGDTESGS